MSYNVALLDAKIFGRFDYAETPFLEERRPVLPDLIFREAFDIILLQEVWVDSDVQFFKKRAEAYGYYVYSGESDDYNDGILTCIKKTRIHQVISAESVPYQVRDPLEYFPGPGIKRGFSFVSYDDAELGRMTVFNTHMLAWPKNWFIRMEESRQIALKIREQNRDGLTLLGGDLNFSSYYPKDAWSLPEDASEHNWFMNALTYPILLHYGDLEDLIVMGRDRSRINDEVVQSQSIPNIPILAQKEAYGDNSFCKRDLGQAFTATDCNQLHFMQYAGLEPPARLDHLLAHDPNKRIAVLESGLKFTQKYPFGTVVIEPSDHYAVYAKLLVEVR
jgi:hypothetical protein